MTIQQLGNYQLCWIIHVNLMRLIALKVSHPGDQSGGIILLQPCFKCLVDKPVTREFKLRDGQFMMDCLNFCTARLAGLQAFELNNKIF
ncbi:hypothetical protein D3C77_714280 [compost metagenome]